MLQRGVAFSEVGRIQVAVAVAVVSQKVEGSASAHQRRAGAFLGMCCHFTSTPTLT
jgi:hypothetical protein